MLNFESKIAKKQNGSSLIEVIVCLFMISVLLVLYASALGTVAMTRKLRYENIAYHIATKQMEQLRNTSYAALPASGTITDTLLTQIPSGTGSYTTVAYPGYAGIKEITVTVTWTDPLNKNVTLKTLAGTGGINNP